MNIIRLKKGHRISLSDNEFRALVFVVEGGQEHFNDAEVDIYAADETEEVRQLIEEIVWTMAPLAINKDRRGGSQ